MSEIFQDSSSIIGGVTVIAWVSVVLWSLAKITKSAWRGGEWKGRHLAAVAASAAISAGVILGIKDTLMTFDTFGLAFVLAALGGLTLWAVAQGK